MSLLKKVIKVTLSAISYVFIGLLLIWVCISFIGFIQKKPVKIFGYGYAVVASGSMEPSVHTGSFVIIYDKSFEEIEVGDIIVYQSKTDDKNIVHRVIQTEGGIVTKGDNATTNPYDDYQWQGYITEERYIGTVTWYGWSSIGWLLIDSRSLLVGFVVIFLLILLIFQAISLTKQLKNKQKQEQEKALENYKKALEEELKTKDE